MVKVGSTLSATPASVTGDPTPVRSWQWLRDNVTISGATAANYYVQAADEGAKLSVRQIETNFVGVATATSAQTATVGAYDPGTLFESGEVGAWYDPSDLTTVYQDAAGTTPATVGDPVGRIDDKSGNGNHATQTTSAARPVLQQSGGLYYLDFDGVDDYMQSAATGWADSTEAMIASAASGPVSTASIVNIAGVTSGSYQNQADSILLRANISGASAFYSNDGTGAKTVSSTYNGTTASIYFGYVDSGTNYLRIDGSETTAVGASGLMSLNQEIDIAFLDNAGSIIQISNLHLFSLIIRTTAPTAGQITDLETYLASKSGVTLP